MGVSKSVFYGGLVILIAVVVIVFAGFLILLAPSRTSPTENSIQMIHLQSLPNDTYEQKETEQTPSVKSQPRVVNPVAPTQGGAEEAIKRSECYRLDKNIKKPHAKLLDLFRLNESAWAGTITLEFPGPPRQLETISVRVDTTTGEVIRCLVPSLAYYEKEDYGDNLLIFSRNPNRYGGYD